MKTYVFDLFLVWFLQSRIALILYFGRNEVLEAGIHYFVFTVALPRNGIVFNLSLSIQLNGQCIRSRFLAFCLSKLQWILSDVKFWQRPSIAEILRKENSVKLNQWRRYSTLITVISLPPVSSEWIPGGVHKAELNSVMQQLDSGWKERFRLLESIQISYEMKDEDFFCIQTFEGWAFIVSRSDTKWVGTGSKLKQWYLIS